MDCFGASGKVALKIAALSGSFIRSRRDSSHRFVDRQNDMLRGLVLIKQLLFNTGLIDISFFAPYVPLRFINLLLISY